MARTAAPFGPSLKGLIEDAPVALATDVILLRESDTEPAFDGLASLAGEPDDASRARIVQCLAKARREELQPLEVRCQRILQLAEGKGATSLDTVVGQQMMGETLAAYREQLDALCRSIWVYLHHRSVFENAESFHFARRFREHGKLYDPFEVDADAVMALAAASVDDHALSKRITEVLELGTACTVHALDLPPAADYPASVMLVIRHGGPLSSVFHHHHDGRRGTIYYRPPNEATLIFTPMLRLIEICGDSPVVRQQVAKAFAEVTLGQDVSGKPLTWRRYNLTRFRGSFRLPLPVVDGFDLQDACVLEAEVRLGNWGRRLSLKVGKDDDIEAVAAAYLRPNNILQRADSYSRIGIAISYNRHGEDKGRTLNITIAGDKRCNLQSNRDPDERSLGYRLLQFWGILSAFRQIDAEDLRALFPVMLTLYDRMEPEVSGAYLRELGLDPDRLIEGGLLERRGRQEVILLDDTEGGDGTVKPSTTPGMVGTVGDFGEDLGERPAADLILYRINGDWLQETLVGLIRPVLAKRTVQVLDPDLMLLGAMRIDGPDVPVYFARRLDDLKTVGRLDLALRARNDAGVGLVLATSAEPPLYLGPNVVVPLLSTLASDEEMVLARDGLELAFRSGRSLALGGSKPQLLKADGQAATLHIPGRPPLAILGANQIKIFERLVAAHNAGSPDVKAGALTEDLNVDSPQQAFRKDNWQSILDVYITKGAKHGFWRLVVDPPGSAVAV